VHELTLSELKDRIIAQVDPDTLIELLDLRIDDLVDAFPDQIEENYDKLIEVLQDEEDDE
jgi:hypothetical protein